MPARTLVLASASPARLSLLRAAGFAPRVEVSGVAEDGPDGMAPHDLARMLAERKAAAVTDRLASGSPPGRPGDAAGDGDPGAGGGGGRDRAPVPRAPGDAVAGRRAPAAVVVGCDSVLRFGGHTRGKPSSPEEARRWWHEQRGDEGLLITGQAVVDLATGRRASGTAEARVRFGTPTDDEVDAYVATGEPLTVAGGFTLDGYAGPFVDGIDGDHGTVLGLSLPLLRRLLAEVGVAVTDLWDGAP